MKVTITLLTLLLSITSFAQKGTIVIPDGHSLLINVVKADHQGRFIYSAEDHKCIMWDRKSGQQLYTFSYNSADPVSGLDISPDGNKLAICAGNELLVFNTLNGEQTGSKNGFSSQSEVVFSSDGKEIYVYEEGIHVLDASTLQEKSFFKSDAYNMKIWLLPGSKLLAASAGKYEIYDLQTGAITFSSSISSETFYSNVAFLPGQQLLVAYGKDKTVVGFYDIYSGKKIGSVKTDYYDITVIPSVNTNEIFITGPQVTEGFYAMDLYSTDNFTLKMRYDNTGVTKWHPCKGGYFDGAKNRAWFIGYNKISEYNTTRKTVEKVLEGVAASLGMDVFNAIDYNQSTGKLNISTDDINLKTIDLYRMVPVLHSSMNEAPAAIAVSASGDTAAIFGFGKAEIRNMRTKKLIRLAKTPGEAGFLHRNAFFFSNNGKNLYYAIDGQDDVSFNKMTTATGISQTLFKVSGFGPMMVHPDKSLLAGFESSYGVNIASVWDLSTGKRIFSHECTVDGEYDDQCIQLSNDKKSVLVVDEGLKVFDIATGSQIPSAQYGGGIDKFGSSGASSDFSFFATGSQYGYLAVFDSIGSQLYTKQAHNSTIRKIFFSPDNKLLYTVSYDNTIKVWETSTGRNIGVLYLFRETNDFVFMDSEGRFDGSPEGIKRIYYLQNQQATALEAVFEIFYVPNLYARSVAGERFPEITIDRLLPAPIVKISYAAVERKVEVGGEKPSYQNTTGTAEITVNASAEGDAVNEIRLFHNGKIVTLTSRNLIVADENDASSATKKYTIPLLPGANIFRAIALNSQRTESKPDEILVTYQTAGVPANLNPIATVTGGTIDKVDKNATLHLIVVGINQYQNQSMVLNYALADATAFKAEIEKDAISILANVKTYFITDNTATKAEITAAFNQVKEIAKPQDVFVFYYAGHGVIGKDKEFYLVPNDVSDLKSVQAELEAKGIPAKLLQRYAIDIGAQKQLFILDACQSAGAFNEMLSADGDQQKSIAVVSRSTGTHWMAASGAQQYANEFSQLGHGAFTYVLLEALKGSAAADKMITVNGLKNYLQQGVPELMKKYSGTLQYPASYGFGNDFPVEILK